MLDEYQISYQLDTVLNFLVKQEKRVNEQIKTDFLLWLRSLEYSPFIRNVF